MGRNRSFNLLHPALCSTFFSAVCVFVIIANPYVSLLAVGCSSLLPRGAAPAGPWLSSAGPACSRGGRTDRQTPAMRRFLYCKVVLATSLVWVLVDVFLLLYFSECNKCDDKKERSLLPALRGECPLGVFDSIYPSLCCLCRFSSSNRQNTRIWSALFP